MVAITCAPYFLIFNYFWVLIDPKLNVMSISFPLYDYSLGLLGLIPTICLKLLSPFLVSVYWSLTVMMKTKSSRKLGFYTTGISYSKYTYFPIICYADDKMLIFDYFMLSVTKLNDGIYSSQLTKPKEPNNWKLQSGDLNTLEL